MNYIKPEDIKAYVEQNPEGIAGMSENLAAMANHFAELIVKECILSIYRSDISDKKQERLIQELAYKFGVEE